jgi:hypothetical protein
MPLKVPDSFQQVLLAAEQSRKPVDEFSLSGEMHKSVKDPTALTDEERKGAWAELAAFRFATGDESGANDPDAYFGPVITATLADGSPYQDPDPKRVDRETVEHWHTRVGQVTHPTLQGRYADLVWEFCRAATGMKALPQFAHTAIDCYLAVSQKGLATDEHQEWRLLDRALSLSLKMGDGARVAEVKKQILVVYRKKRNSGETFMWWTPDDLLWERRKAVGLTPAEQQELIQGLEHFLALHADMAKPDGFDPHLARGAADRLSSHYHAMGQADRAREAVARSGKAFEQAAEKADGLVATAWLQDVLERYRQAGMAEDATRVEALVRARSADAAAEMKKIEVPLDIKKEEIDRWLDEITDGTAEQALVRIAVRLTVREDSTRQQVLEQAKIAPIQALMPIDIAGPDGFTVAKIGSVEDDLEGRVIHHATQMLSFKAPWLGAALDKALEKHRIGLEHLMTHIYACPFFVAPKHSLLRQGVEGWLAGDSLKAVHVLIPQVEAALREMLRALGGSIMRRDPRSGGFDVIGMGQVLHDPLVRAKFDRNARLHFLALYSDPRGLNMRNRVSHGLVTQEQVARGVANWVIHSLLLLSLFRTEKVGDPGAAKDQAAV